MMTILEKILGRKRVLVKENERAVALYKGEVLGILGRASICCPTGASGLEVERHDLGNAGIRFGLREGIVRQAAGGGRRALHRRSAPAAARSP